MARCYRYSITSASEPGRSLPAAAAVDHFIPWSRYPRDLAHNLVLAHGTCNSRKNDLLGGEVYLGRWAQFVSDHGADQLVATGPDVRSAPML